jgi:hypothetical protein
MPQMVQHELTFLLALALLVAIYKLERKKRQVLSILLQAKVLMF